MKSTRWFSLVVALICTITGWAQTWLGSGNSADPYILKSSNEWEALAKQVAEGNNFQNQFFRLSADIDTRGIQVGTAEKPFCGTFDGNNHTLTFNRGIEGGFVSEACAPFGCLRGAIVRHVKTTGKIWSTDNESAGIALSIDGAGTTKGTKIVDCRSDIDILLTHSGSVVAGGLVGKVNGNVTVAPVFEKCVFTGSIRGSGKEFGGLVGWSNTDITFKNCMFDPQRVESGIDVGSATYVRLAQGATATFENCFCTRYMGTEQGQCVFGAVNVTAGCSYKMVDEPFVQFDGKPYWKSGSRISLTVPEGVEFDHWGSTTTFISNPWRKNGEHVLQDITGPVFLNVVANSIPEGKVFTEQGVKYRYLNKSDYHFYVSDELCKAKGWKFHSDDDLVIYDSNGEAAHITAVVGYDETRFPDDGVQIINDVIQFLSASGQKHSRLGLIAPRAFYNCLKLESLYFKDANSSFYSPLMGFDFFIDEEAFRDCPIFENMKMMQYTTEGSDHWEALKPNQVFSIASNAFDETTKMKISCHATEYQNFLNSETWSPFQDRISIYDATVTDETVDGVKYHYYRDATESRCLTNNDMNEMIDNHLLTWSADYKNLIIADLLKTKDKSTVYYTSIVGVNDNDIDDKGGVMRIYNDMGSNYNYKTLALGRNAIADNEHVKVIEFYQTNGNGESSYSDLKMVIQNGALKGCKNLKELRMFYYVQDGDDHWESLGPENVIPGDNIFGEASLEELEGKSNEERAAMASGISSDFKILVSTERYQEFLDDPNWSNYIKYLKPTDFFMTDHKKDYNKYGLNYSYMASPGGVLKSSQVVSQDVSWWTAPRIAVEVIMMAASLASTSKSVARETVGNLVEQKLQAEADKEAFAIANNNVMRMFIAHDEANIPFNRSLFTNINKFVDTPYGMDIWLQRTYDGSILYGFSRYNDLLPVLSVDNHILTGNLAINNSLHILNTMEGLECDYVSKMLNAIFTKYSREAERIITDLSGQIAEAMAGVPRSAFVKAAVLNAAKSSAVVSSASYLATECWGGSGSYNGDALQKGMRANILSNIHQVGLVGGGYVITTPSKNIVYHTYIKSVDDSTKVAKIYGGFDEDGNAFTSDRLMTFDRDAFKNKTKLERVEFYTNDEQSSRSSMPMLLTIPDSAFVGCSALTEFNTLMYDKDGGRRALGPENFILAGDSIFAGLDSAKFRIVIGLDRKQDFLDNESWAPLEKYFTYKSANPVNQHSLYGANYAYAYEMNSIQKVKEVMGHKVEHTLVTGPDDEFIKDHQGAVKLINDLGNYNNYQLDYVAAKAFTGNENLRSVSFTDMNGFLFIGDNYSSLDITLQDSCFADCKNLVNLDLLYMKTDGINELQPMTPQHIKIGKGVLDGTNARIKMMPQQVAWFEADSTWSEYKDRFLPCVIRFSDSGIKKALEDMSYYDPANEGTDNALWKDYCDLARIGGAGFSWLDGKFQAQHKDIYSFGDFKHFQSVGLNYVGKSWFEGCSNMGDIMLPDSIADIQEKAFKDCSALREIELPQAVATIGNNAFAGCSKLNVIRVLGEKPAALGTGAFHKHDGLKIYVPAGKAADYKAAWSEYADYIVDGVPAINKVVTVTAVGQLADKLGLKPIWQNSFGTISDKDDSSVTSTYWVRYIQGPYTRYDSLTIIGPLNGVDLSVIRHLAGANAYGSDRTDGQLKYLNLWDADIMEDEDHCYNGNSLSNLSTGLYYITDDNLVPDYLFENCEAIETIILPKSATVIGENIFEDAKSLKRVCVGRKTTEYNTDLLQNLDGIDELVFLTEGFAQYGAWISWFFNNPWEAPIQAVYTTRKQIGNYAGDTKLVNQAQNIVAPFEDDAVTWALADNGHFFPSEYLQLKSTEGIFNSNTDIKSFSDFRFFSNVKRLENTFAGNSNMTRITLPRSIEYISASAFSGCTSLDTISISCDSVPTLEDDAFASLPADFKIFVPKYLCKLYRETWVQYADHINMDRTDYSNNGIITVTVTEPNTLAQVLGMDMDISWAGFNGSFIWSAAKSLKGDYSNINKLKVVGPISGADIDLLKYMAGWCPWTHSRNFAGHLEYLDLYDADIRGTAAGVWGYRRDQGTNYAIERTTITPVDDDVLPYHAFLRAYSLKTLILPKTCLQVEERALQECEGLEVLVVGDSIMDFSWTALDDDAMLTRMYLLAKKPMDIHSGNPIINAASNNYSPTFDAFYVLPSQYAAYLGDNEFTGDQTNLISKGVFDEDDAFCAFASHGAATIDDLASVSEVDGWFKNHTDISDLTMLRYTAIDSLHTADIQPLTNLKKIALPLTLMGMEDSLFSKAPNLRYVDMQMCDSTDIIANVKEWGFSRLGIDSLQTLVYVPATYGTASGTNIVIGDNSGMKAETFRLNDGKDYYVPYAFKAENVENTRILAKSAAPYTVCLPYGMPIPDGAKAYKLSGRSTNELIFTETLEPLEALQPYLIWTANSDASLNTSEVDIPANNGNFYGQRNDAPGFTLTGTLNNISNADAADMRAYVLQADGKWHPVMNDTQEHRAARILPYRAYLLQSSRKNLRTIGLTLEDATGIVQYRTVDSDGTERIYDLNGREISEPVNGIIIKNGQKVFISK